MASRLRTFLRRVCTHLGWLIRDQFPHRKVVREVQGVTMTLPWSHRLPDYAAGDSPYGQNLVQLASALAARASEPIAVLDVGANVGDSTLQILHAADARVLCVEGDPEYLEYLHLNTDPRPEVTIVEALLSSTPDAQAQTAVRSGGTTRFVVGDNPDAMRTITTEELRGQAAGFADLRLVKSDTDGYDVDLIPAIAKTWEQSHPVLFFEYDPVLSRKAGNDPHAVWAALDTLGYRTVAVWGNGGHPLGRAASVDIPSRDGHLGGRDMYYWDVALAHESDADGLAALEALVPQAL